MKEEEEFIISSKNHIFNTSPNLLYREEIKYKGAKKSSNTIQLRSSNKIELKLPRIDKGNQIKLSNKNVLSTQFRIQNKFIQDKCINNLAKSFDSIEFKNKINEKHSTNEIGNTLSPKSMKYAVALESSKELGIFQQKRKDGPVKINLKISSDHLKISKESNVILKPKISQQKEVLNQNDRESNINKDCLVTNNDIRLLKETDKSQKTYVEKIYNLNEKNHDINKEYMYRSIIDDRSIGATMQDFGTQINLENELKLYKFKIENEAPIYSENISFKKKLKNQESILNNYNFIIGSIMKSESDVTNFNNYSPNKKFEKDSNINNFIYQTEKISKYSNFASNSNFSVNINNLNTNNLINFNKFFNQNNKTINDNEMNSDILKTKKIKKNLCFSPLNKSNNKENVYRTKDSKSPTFSKGKNTFSSFNNKTDSGYEIYNSGMKDYMNPKDMYIINFSYCYLINVILTFN